MSGVHLSLVALARSWLAASVVSCRYVMVKVENRSCRQRMGPAEWGQSRVSPLPSLSLSVLSPSHFCPPHPQIQGHRGAQVARALPYSKLVLQAQQQRCPVPAGQREKMYGGRELPAEPGELQKGRGVEAWLGGGALI